MQENNKKFGFLQKISSKTTRKPQVTPIVVNSRRVARKLEPLDTSAFEIASEIRSHGDFKKSLAGLGPLLRKSTREGGFDRGGLEGLGKMKKVLETIDAFAKVESGSPQYEKLKETLSGQLKEWSLKDQEKKKDRRETDPTSLKKRQLCECLLTQLECQSQIEMGGGDRKALLQQSRQAAAQLSLLSGSAKPPEGKGGSDSFFIRNSEGKREFIFKPMQGEAVQPGWPVGGGVSREVVLGEFSEFMHHEFGINFGVPRTSVVNLQSPDFAQGTGSKDLQRTGALQDVVESEGDAETFFASNMEKYIEGDRVTRTKILDWKASLDDQAVQEIALLDFITLNVDRNPGNILVGAQGDNSKRQVTPIDCGNLLPPPEVFEKRAGSMFSPTQPGGAMIISGNVVAQLPQSAKAFSPEMLQKIASLDPVAIGKGLALAEKKLPMDLQGKISKESMTMAEQSVEFLKLATKTKPRITLNTISYLYSKFFNDFRRGVENPTRFMLDAIKVSEREALELEKEALVAYLGGSHALIKKGVANPTDISLDARIRTLQSDHIDAVLKGLKELLPLIKRNEESCDEALLAFERKRENYSELERTSSEPLDNPIAKQQRLELLERENLEVGGIMKKFGPWNKEVISPWKELQTLIDNNNLLVNRAVRDVNREVNLAYDVYVQALSAAQDLGQDHLDLLGRLKIRAKGAAVTEDSLIQDIEHLQEQMVTGSFATLVMIEKQQTEVLRIEQALKSAFQEYEVFSERDWNEVMDWDTKVRQAFEIVKANSRATIRGREHLQDFLSLLRESKRVKSAAQPIADGIEKALRISEDLALVVESLLKGIAKLVQLMPKDESMKDPESKENSKDEIEFEDESQSKSSPVGKSDESGVDEKQLQIVEEQVHNALTFEQYVISNPELCSALKINSSRAEQLYRVWTEAMEDLANLRDDRRRSFEEWNQDVAERSQAVSSISRVNQLIQEKALRSLFEMNK